MQPTGIGEEELVRKEMASLLCMSDRQHSQLSELMPERSGMSGNSKELFEPTLSKVTCSFCVFVYVYMCACVCLCLNDQG